MQRLVFEKAWDKTIDSQDRQDLVKAFEKANQADHPERFIPFWQARNHRDDLLITVIIQNLTDDILTLDGVRLTYDEKGYAIATHTFSDARLTLEPRCSMPWTFIFPKSTIQQEPELESGYVRERN
ncbi:SLAP domain-containing protein [Agaribacter marinus]|uniref:SLAP domain-containing protein n=1 Tax=Virgibacillus salarius TaxID=447199 RepID=A0A941DTM0_9BACI|nr:MULTISPECIES: SLAP domain-containing protein [Bacillaceae]MBR7795162.1 SLAP domain-containing protein [Virgibacillus salarius]MDY7042982.1 SLAP domain-containing protein [Virgibacillus sp. M23]NAZ07878.1 SLAP domain-containing protein [Agaribacter marinus]